MGLGSCGLPSPNSDHQPQVQAPAGGPWALERVETGCWRWAGKLHPSHLSYIPANITHHNASNKVMGEKKKKGYFHSQSLKARGAAHHEAPVSRSGRVLHVSAGAEHGAHVLLPGGEVRGSKGHLKPERGPSPELGGRKMLR